MSTFATDLSRTLTLPTALLLALASSPAHSDSVTNDPVEVLRCWAPGATVQVTPGCTPQVAPSILDLPLFAGARSVNGASTADKPPAPAVPAATPAKAPVEPTVGKPGTDSRTPAVAAPPPTINTTKTLVEPPVGKPVVNSLAPGGTTPPTISNAPKTFAGPTVAKPVINSLAPTGGIKPASVTAPKAFFVNHKVNVGPTPTKVSVPPVKFEPAAPVGKSLRWIPSDAGGSRFGSKQESYRSGVKRY